MTDTLPPTPALRIARAIALAFLAVAGFAALAGAADAACGDGASVCVVNQETISFSTDTDCRDGAGDLEACLAQAAPGDRIDVSGLEIELDGGDVTIPDGTTLWADSDFDLYGAGQVLLSGDLDVVLDEGALAAFDVYVIGPGGLHVSPQDGGLASGEAVFGYALGLGIPLDDVDITVDAVYLAGDVTTTGDQSYVSDLWVSHDGIRLVTGGGDVTLGDVYGNVDFVGADPGLVVDADGGEVRSWGYLGTDDFPLGAVDFPDAETRVTLSADLTSTGAFSAAGPFTATDSTISTAGALAFLGGSTILEGSTVAGAALDVAGDLVATDSSLFADGPADFAGALTLARSDLTAVGALVVAGEATFEDAEVSTWGPWEGLESVGFDDQTYTGRVVLAGGETVLWAREVAFDARIEGPGGMLLRVDDAVGFGAEVGGEVPVGFLASRGVSDGACPSVDLAANVTADEDIDLECTVRVAGHTTLAAYDVVLEDVVFVEEAMLTVDVPPLFEEDVGSYESIISGTVTGPGGIAVTGGGVLELYGENSHAGTQAVHGTVRVGDDAALGSGPLMLVLGVLGTTPGAEVVTIPAEREILAFGGEGRCSALAPGLDATLVVEAAVVGDCLFIEEYGVELASDANDLSGPTVVFRELTLSGTLPGVVLLDDGELSGDAELADATLTLVDGATLAADVSGAGAVCKRGAGTATITGDTAEFEGNLWAVEGMLRVEGDLSSAATSIQPGAVLDLAGGAVGTTDVRGRLAGWGRIAGDLDVLGALVDGVPARDAVLAPAGVLTIDGDASMTASLLEIELAAEGARGSLNVGGMLSLGQYLDVDSRPALDVSFVDGFAPEQGMVAVLADIGSGTLGRFDGPTWDGMTLIYFDDEHALEVHMSHGDDGKQVALEWPLDTPIPDEEDEVEEAGPDPCPGPENDCLADALGIVETGGSRSLSTIGATTEIDEGFPCGDMGATVWFMWVPAYAGEAVVDTLGSSFDAIAAVYTGSLFDLDLVACTDDGVEDVARSEVAFRVAGAAWETYFIQVGGAGGATGDLVLNVALDPAPAGDAEIEEDVEGPSEDETSTEDEGTTVDDDTTEDEDDDTVDPPRPSGGGGGGSGGRASPPPDPPAACESGRCSVKVVSDAVAAVEFVSADAAGPVTVHATATPMRPSSVTPPEASVVRYVDLEVRDKAGRKVDVSDAKVTFKVTLPEVAPDAGPGIVVLHFDDGRWVPLETSFTRGANGVFEVTVSTPHFSVFAVAHDESAPAFGDVSPAEGAVVGGAGFVKVRITDDVGLALARTVVEVDGMAVAATWDADTLTAPMPTSAGAHVVEVTVRDLAGRQSVSTWTFEVAPPAIEEDPAEEAASTEAPTEAPAKAPVDVPVALAAHASEESLGPEPVADEPRESPAEAFAVALVALAAVARAHRRGQP